LIINTDAFYSLKLLLKKARSPVYLTLIILHPVPEHFMTNKHTDSSQRSEITVKIQLQLKILFSVLFVCLLITSCGSKQLANDELRDVLSSATARIVVVNYFNQIISEGSGFLIDKRGYIVTNYHVIAPGKGNGIIIYFEPTGTKFWRAQLILQDILLDFAILKINCNCAELKPVKLGNSDNVKQLDEIFVAGYPMGGALKISRGEITSYSQRIGKSNLEYIDTSAQLDPGNSGGPLLNSSGEVIGINTMIAGRTFNLALKINYVKSHIGTVIREADRRSTR